MKYMYLYFVLLYIILHLIVTNSGTWIRVGGCMLIFYFDLLWPSVPECPVTVRLARQPLQPKVIQSPRIHILQKYQKIVHKYNMFGTQNQTSNYKGKES